MQFETFHDVNNKELRIWNRCASVYNILARHGNDAMQKYLTNFTEVEREELSQMFATIKEQGYESVRARINREAATVAVA